MISILFMKKLVPPLLALLAVAAVADEAAETGKWRHHRTETALEAVDYLLLDADVGERTWTLARRCDLKEAWIQSSASYVGEALDYSLSYLRYSDRDDEWIRYYKTRIRQDETPIKEWTWRYGYSADFGIEFLTFKYTSNIDKLILGDRLVMEISPARGVAVFETRGFGEAIKHFCPEGTVRYWVQAPNRLEGASHGYGDSRNAPRREDQTADLAARVVVAAHDGQEGIAVQVLDPWDWHDVSVYIRDTGGFVWRFKWPEFDGKGETSHAIHIPFEYFQRLEARRYWRSEEDEIEAVFIIAHVPVSWKPGEKYEEHLTHWEAGDGGGYREYEETGGRFVIRSPIPTVTWEEASRSEE